MVGYSYVRPRQNDMRFVTWKQLLHGLQDTALERLHYTRETCDVLGSNPIESLRCSDLSDGQRIIAMELGFDEDSGGASWNCWMNHRQSFSWKQLHALELTPYLRSLGLDMRTIHSAVITIC